MDTLEMPAPGPPDVDPPAAPAAPPRQRILGGVADSMATAFDVDPLWIRMTFVVLALAGGVGILLYGGLWLLLVVGRRPGLGGLRIAGGAVVVLSLLVLLDLDRGDIIDGPPAVVALLIGLAFALWQPRLDRATSVLPPPGTLPAPMPVAAAPRPPRERSALGRTTLGIAVVAASVGGLVDQGNGGRMHPEQWLGLAAMVCGLGLLVGIVRGRARWLIVPALLFAGAGYVAGVAARLGIPSNQLRGDRWVSIWPDMLGGDQAPSTLRGDISVSIDGTTASADDPMRVTATVGFGHVSIWHDGVTPTLVRWDIDHGSADLDGRRQHGSEVHLGEEGRPRVIVDVRMAYGDLTMDERADTIGMQPTPTWPAITLPPPVPGGPLAALGSLTPVADGVQATSDGWFVLFGGEAVIDDEDQAVVGDTYQPGGGTTGIFTSMGEFRLLPRGILLTPTGTVVDLRAVRAALAATPTTTTTAVAAGTTTSVRTSDEPPGTPTTPPTVAPSTVTPGTVGG